MGFLSSTFKSVAKAAGSIVGGVVGAAGSLIGAHQSAKYAEAAQNRDIAFQTDYQQNRHQWEVADLKAAGLNPILSANSAGGSVGASSSGMAGNIDPAQHLKELSLLNSQIDLNNSQSAKNISDANLANQQAITQESVRNQSKALTDLYAQQSLTQVAQRLQIGAQARLQNANSARAEMDNAYLSKYPDVVAMNNTRDPLMRYAVGLREATQQAGSYVLNRVKHSAKSLTLPNVQQKFDRGFDNYGY